MVSRLKLTRFLLLAVILLLPLYYLRFSLVLPTNVIEVVIALAAISFLTEARRLPASLPKGVIWPILLVLVGIFLGAIIATDRQAAFGILKGWFIVPVIFFWLASDVFTAEDVPLIGQLLAANIIIVSIYAVLENARILPLTGYQMSSSLITDYVNQGRAIAFFESPNYLAMYLVPASFMAIGLLVNAKKQYVAWATGILAVIALSLTHSRGGLLGLIVGLAFLLVWRYRSRFYGWLLLVASLVGGLLVSGRASDTDRLTIWKEAAHLIKAHPLLGIGPGQFQHYFASDHPGAALIDFALHPHNIFLAFWLSGGLLGLIGFVWLLTVLIRKGLSNPSVVSGVALASLGAVLGHGLVDTAYFKNDLAILFWLSATLLVIASKPSSVVE